MTTTGFKKSTNFSGGISVGGKPEDGGWEHTRQPTLLTVKISQSAKSMTLPAGTIILERVLYPDSDAPAVTGGTVTLADTTNAVTYIAALTSAIVVLKGAVTTPVRLAAAATITATPATMTAGEFVRVGLLVILPQERS